MIPPVFVKKDLPQAGDRFFSTADICGAAERAVGFQQIDGAQQIGGLWRIYPMSVESRHKLLIEGFTLRGVKVTVSSQNPFLVKRTDGSETEMRPTKLIIGGVPYSGSDSEILESLKALNLTIMSDLAYELDRDRDGKLTRWKTGRRFLYVDCPPKPLGRTLKIGRFEATLYHREQKEAGRPQECRNCGRPGHLSSVCEFPPRCWQCEGEGHKRGIYRTQRV